MSPTSRLAHLESLLRSGQISQASSELEELRHTELARPDLATFANLARRTGNTRLAVEVLRPFVKPKPRENIHPSESEILEYAMALISIGALNEGMNLLQKLPAQASPLKLLYAAFGRIHQWNYLEASKLLEGYLKVCDPDDYFFVIAQVNLISAYLFAGQYPEAETLMSEMLKKATTPELSRVREKLLNLACQLSIQQGRLVEAQHYLDETQRSFPSRSNIDLLLHKKWMLILNIIKEGSRKEYHEALIQLRAEARLLKAYEVVRDADYYLGLYFQEQASLFDLYFGTPYQSFRERVLSNHLRIVGRPLELPDGHGFVLQGSEWRPLTSSKKYPFVNISNGANSYGDGRLKNNHLLQKILAMLVHDIYRPLNIHQIHNEVFEETFFNPQTTPRKIYLAVYRLRDWMQETGIPIDLGIEDNFVVAKSSEPIEFRVPGQATPDYRIEDFRDSLQKTFSESTFSTNDVSDRLGMPSRTASKYLKLSIDAGLVSKLGAGRKTCFKVK
jgi:tetratricopeptide (TPR) repeat protein